MKYIEKAKKAFN